MKPQLRAKKPLLDERKTMTAQELKTAAKMVELRDTMKRLYGTKWEEASAPYREILSGVMARTGDTNPLSAVLPLAKDLSSKGHNPKLLLAVAVDMCAALHP